MFSILFCCKTFVLQTTKSSVTDGKCKCKSSALENFSCSCVWLKAFGPRTKSLCVSKNSSRLLYHKNVSLVTAETYTITYVMHVALRTATSKYRLLWLILLRRATDKGCEKVYNVTKIEYILQIGDTGSSKSKVGSYCEY